MEENHRRKVNMGGENRQDETRTNRRWGLLEIVISITLALVVAVYGITWQQTASQTNDNTQCIQEVQIKQATIEEAVRRIDDNTREIKQILLKGEK